MIKLCLCDTKTRRVGRIDCARPDVPCGVIATVAEALSNELVTARGDP